MNVNAISIDFYNCNIIRKISVIVISSHRYSYYYCGLLMTFIKENMLNTRLKLVKIKMHFLPHPSSWSLLGSWDTMF